MWRRFRSGEWRRGRAWFTTAPRWTEEDEIREKARRKHLRRHGMHEAATIGPSAGRADRTAAPTFVNVQLGPEDGPYACPCCRALTLPTRGGFDLCPVCFWEDDGQDDNDADEVRGGPNGGLSLTQARANYVEFGASDGMFLSRVRPPKRRERPAT